MSRPALLEHHTKFASVPDLYFGARRNAAIGKGTLLLEEAILRSNISILNRNNFSKKHTLTSSGSVTSSLVICSFVANLLASSCKSCAALGFLLHKRRTPYVCQVWVWQSSLLHYESRYIADNKLLVRFKANATEAYLQQATTVFPASSSCLVNSRPIPRLAPVTNAVFPTISSPSLNAAHTCRRTISKKNMR